MTDLDFERRFGAAYRRYLDEVPVAVDAAAIARAAAVAHPARRARWAWDLRPARAFSLLALLGLLLLALVAAALFAGALRLPRHLSALSPTGIDVLTPDPGTYGRVVADGSGILWARQDGGRLVRFDPATGSGRAWTVGDDAAFETADIAPAAGGGVWLVDGWTLRWFDGTGFRGVVRAPAAITAVAEARDGTLWAATADGLVLHWGGSSWTTLDPGRPDPSAVIGAIAVDRDGRPWVGWSANRDDEYIGSVSRYEGKHWTTFDGSATSLLGRDVQSILTLPNGDVWVSTVGGVARFDGTRWTDETAGLLAGGHPLAAGPDGAVWAADDRSIGAVARFDGQSWEYHGPPAGLPGGSAQWAGGARRVLATKDGVFVAVGGGIFRLADERWERAWPPAAAPRPRLLLAISRDELWARDGDGHARGWVRGDSGLWHFRDGAWTNEPMSPNLSTYGPDVMAVAPDGTLWAAGEAGVAYLRDGRWTLVDGGPADPSGWDDGAARAIAFDANRTVWVAGTMGAAGGWPATASRLWRLTFDGTSWVRQVITGCPVDPMSLAVDKAGALWVGDPAGRLAWVADASVGLARFDGREWQTVHEVDGSAFDGATVLGTAPDGAMWVAVVDRSGDGQAEAARLARFDGTAWTLVDLPSDVVGAASVGDLVLAPDGSLWASTSRGAARYDGRAWSFPYADIVPSAVAWGSPAYAVAADGTVFGQTPTGIARMPAVPRP